MAVAAANLAGQTSRQEKADKGPRAVGLLELAPNGKGHLIPVVILDGGQFYDASAYKAAPVPMALEYGTVYEAEKSGASLGLFTITGAAEGQNNYWIAQGTWEPAGSKPVSKKHTAEITPRDIEPKEGPPVLRRRQPQPEAQPSSSPSQPPASPPAPAPPASSAPPSPPASSSTPAPGTIPAEPAQSSSSEQANDQDPNRPALRRGKPTATTPSAAAAPGPPTAAKTAAPGKTSAATNTAAMKPAVAMIQIIPAISDAHGPQPHSYLYPLKSGEEQQFQQKMLALAADEVRARSRQLAGNAAASNSAASGSHPTRAKTSAKPATKVQPTFSDIQLHIFDLSLSNEPILVLTATAQIPPRPGYHEPLPPSLQYFVTLVAHQDIYGDMHKAFSRVTDTQHLDVLPRYDFIDAVDADGDGRGELLFRQNSEAGTAFDLYRVIGDQLWPLFQGTPGQ